MVKPLRILETDLEIAQSKIKDMRKVLIALKKETIENNKKIGRSNYFVEKELKRLLEEV